MALKPIADKAVAQICKIVSSPMSDDEQARISKIVEQAMIDAAVSASQRSCRVVKNHTGNEEDLAHKLAKELKLAETALIANLTGMR